MTRALLAIAICTCAATAHAQDYPAKPIRIVTSEPGSSLDFAARLIAQGLTTSLGQQVIVDNRRVLSIEIVAKAPPDGYTLLVYGSPIWIMPFLQEVAYDPVRDFAPISMVLRSPNVLVIHPSVPAASVKELIALARARPGALNYGSSVSGGTPHLAGELFKYMARVNIVRVPYRGVAPAMTELVAGQVQLMFPTAATGMPHAKAGRLRALAVTSAQPLTAYPELPTVAASGLPGYELVAMQGLFAPAKTPVTLVNRLHQEVANLLARPDVRDKFLVTGSEPVGDTPAQFAATMKTDMARMARLIKETGIRAD